MDKLKKFFSSITGCIFIALMIRLIVILVFYKVRNNDVDAFLLAGRSFLLSLSSHSPPSYYLPYFPLLIYFIGFSVFLMEKFAISYVIFLKLFFALFDVGIVYLIYLLDNKRIKNSWIYAINPISILITCFQGQFDSIALFFLLLAIFFWKRKKTGLFYLSGSFAIAVKTWPLLFFIPVFKQSKKNLSWLLLGIIPLITILTYLYIFKGFNILKTLLVFRGLYGWFGFGYFASIFTNQRIIFHLLSSLFLLSFFIFSWLQKEKNIFKNILNQMLFFFIFTISFGIQWLMWPLPFLLLTRPKYFKFYLIFASTILLFIYSQWTGLYYLNDNFLKLIGLSVWLLFLLMGSERFRYSLNPKH